MNLERIAVLAAFVLILAVIGPGLEAQRTEKPVLHGRHWIAITGKPMAATAGARMFLKGGNAVDAACAMLGSVCTMWDVLSWGGETQALIYHPGLKKVVAVNALGVAPTGATPEFYRSKGHAFPPATGVLSAVTPGTPGGLITMLAEYGTLSLKDVLAPAMELAAGYPMEKDTADRIEKDKAEIKKWKYARAVMLPHLGEKIEAPSPGEVFSQPDLLETLTKLVEAEQQA
jgi:gamma-glutamyltranspeptidase/glutathione hydrolase